VPPDDPEALADALVDLLDHPARAAAMGAAGRELALADFSVDRMAERTADVYEEVLSSSLRKTGIRSRGFRSRENP
jgi:glycosyltransferase involved in cell wall biosynthesis